MKKFAIQKCPMMAELSATYKSKVPVKDRIKVSQSSEVVSALRSVWNDDNIEYVEEMVILFLNRANAVLGWAKISTGGTDGTVCDPKVIFQLALLHNASGIILSHNHPSGNLNPSKADQTMTDRIVKSGVMLGVSVLDHVIITAESYYSFADNDLI